MMPLIMAIAIIMLLTTVANLVMQKILHYKNMTHGEGWHDRRGFDKNYYSTTLPASK